jgi:hypothetical protein
MRHEKQLAKIKLLQNKGHSIEEIQCAAIMQLEDTLNVFTNTMMEKIREDDNGAD